MVKGRQNEQTNNDPQRITQKTNIHAILTTQRPGMSSDAPDKLAVPALLVIPVVVKIIIQIQVCFSLHNNLHLFVMLHVMLIL